MADASEIRAWLRDNGHEVDVKGRIPRHLQDAYYAHHQEPSGDVTGTDPDDDAGADDAEAVRPEVQPKRPRAARPKPQGIMSRLAGSGRPKTKSGARKKHPRVSLESMTGWGWKALARVSAPISPATSACLSLQAPMAGIIVDDVVKGTIVDRVAQPLARNAEKGRKVGALMAPLFVLGIDVANRMEDQREGALRAALLVEMLRESLRVNLELSEMYADELAERRERDAATDAEVDKLLGMIFGQVVVHPEGETAEPEMADAT